MERKERNQQYSNIRYIYKEELQEILNFIKSESQENYLQSTSARTKVQDGSMHHKKEKKKKIK